MHGLCQNLTEKGWQSVCSGSKAANTIRLLEKKLLRLRAPLGDLWTPFKFFPLKIWNIP